MLTTLQIVALVLGIPLVACACVYVYAINHSD